MRVLFDLTAAQSIHDTKNHGAMEYCITVFLNLLSVENSDALIETFINPKYSIQNLLMDICVKKNIIVHKCSRNQDLTNILKREFDVFYSAMPYRYNNIVIPKNTLFIYTIHGLRDIEIYKDKYQFSYSNNNLKAFIKKIILLTNIKQIRQHYVKNIKDLIHITENKKIITVSNHTKYALLNFFPELKNEEIPVLYSPPKSCLKINSNQNEEDRTLKKYSLQAKGYILLISGNRWIKNCIRGCIAIDKLFSKNINILHDIKVVVLGVTNPQKYKKYLKNPEKFMLVSSYIEDIELEILYKNAHLFLYPTLNEGFGYPPLEAMKYNTLVALSAICSLTEICKDIALYFNPYDIDEISNRVLQSFDMKIVNDKKVLFDKVYFDIFNRQEKDLQILIKMILGRII